MECSTSIRILITPLVFSSSSLYLCYEIVSRSWRDVLDTTWCDKVCQWLASGRWWVSPSTPLSSTKTNNRHDMTDILLKVALKHHKPKPNPFIFTFPKIRSFMKRRISCSSWSFFTWNSFLKASLGFLISIYHMLKHVHWCIFVLKKYTQW